MTPELKQAMDEYNQNLKELKEAVERIERRQTTILEAGTTCMKALGVLIDKSNAKSTY